MSAESMLRRLQWVGTAEGISFLLLLGVAMPLKYLAGMPLGVTIVGSAHGVLWVLYLVVIWRAGRMFKWGVMTQLWGVAASVLPFGPFVFDAWAVRTNESRLAQESAKLDPPEERKMANERLAGEEPWSGK